MFWRVVVSTPFSAAAANSRLSLPLINYTSIRPPFPKSTKENICPATEPLELTTSVFSKRPGGRVCLEKQLQLGIRDVLGLRDLDPRQHEADGAEPAEDEPDLAAEISLVGVEHVRHAKGEHPGHEGVDQEAQAQCLGPKGH